MSDVNGVESLADLIPPRWDQEVEEALAGALLDKPAEVWPRVAGRVIPDDFHDPRIAKVWEVATGSPTPQ
jgi:replicative DNA helicase